MERICYILHVCIMSLLDSSGAITVQQFPTSLFGKLNDNVQLSCQHDDSTYYTMLWYQQVEGQQALDLVGFLTHADMSGLSLNRRSLSGPHRWSWPRAPLWNSSAVRAALISTCTDVQCQSQQKVSQWPSQTVVTQGSSVELQCSQSSSNQNMYWYHQQSSTEIHLIMLSVYMNQPERGKNISGRFTSTRPKMENITLSISQAEESDTGSSLPVFFPVMTALGIHIT
ncbi:hypothetical protein SKAU_G00353180 [Synaphobranchus kaupii]|uniref:Immunoglobulin V-set domain-containing protein n=1 Tax=Synaphobranchus kaupii TaxID=118154 RepID=A0A9Q1EKX5_SYNKA|nr:hypothetical protein SKAU_G00353180 [Synaphobranchus kaupii]